MYDKKRINGKRPAKTANVGTKIFLAAVAVLFTMSFVGACYDQ